MKTTRNMSKALLLGASIFLLIIIPGSYTIAATCINPPSDLVSWWPGDGDANDIIDGNNPSAESGVSFVSGKVLQGITLASGGFIDIPDNANLNLQTFTFDAWVKPKAADSTSLDAIGDVIFQKALAFFTLPQVSYHLSWSSLNDKWHVLFGVTPGSQGQLTSSGSYAPGQFYHVAVTYDGVTLSLYVDGMLDSSANINKSILYSTEQAVIGANAKIFRPPNATFPRTWQGVIDELELYDRALSASEIMAIFSAGVEGKCKGPITVTVDIDIKPGSFPNSINLSSGGATPVAILGSATFDVTLIDTSTLTLGTSGVKTVGKTARELCSVVDVSGDFSSGPEGAPDSFDDLVCHFVTMGMAPEAGDTQAKISGALNDATPIEGTDSVNIVP